MLNPIEQSPALAYEPARQQQIVQHPQTEGAAAVTSSQTAALSTTGQVQQSASSAPGGNTTGGAEDDNSGSSSGDQGSASQQLGAAWSTLANLKHQAAAAVESGNLSTARALASEAAGIAGSIRDIVSMAGGASSAGAEMDLQEADAVTAEAVSHAGGSSSSSQSGSSNGVGTTTSQGTSPLDLARASLSTAKDVVDSVMQQPGLTQADQSALISQQQMVVQAMAAVELTASQQSAGSELVSSYAVHSLVDIKA